MANPLSQINYENLNEENELTKIDTNSKIPSKRIDKKNLIDLMHSAFNLFILIKSLKFADAKFKEKYKKWKQEHDYTGKDEKSQKKLKALRFYAANIKMIEIVNSKKEIQRVYFKLHPVVKSLSQVSMDEFNDNVTRDSANQKINGLIYHEKMFFQEMLHFIRLRQRGLKVNLTFYFILRICNLLIAIIIALILLINVKSNLLPNESPHLNLTVIKIFGLQNIFNFFYQYLFFFL